MGRQARGIQRATSIHDTQTAATERARKIARWEKSELLVHGRDGEIRSRHSFGHDPFPPKGCAGFASDVDLAPICGAR